MPSMRAYNGLPEGQSKEHLKKMDTWMERITRDIKKIEKEENVD